MLPSWLDLLLYSVLWGLRQGLGSDRDRIAFADGVSHQVGILLEVKFLHDFRPMILNGAETEKQGFRNFFARFALGDHFDDLNFPRREGIGQFGVVVALGLDIEVYQVTGKQGRHVGPPLPDHVDGVEEFLWGILF